MEYNKINIIKGASVTVQYGKDLKEESKRPKPSFGIDKISEGKVITIHLDGKLAFTRRISDVTIQDNTGESPGIPVQLTSENWNSLTEGLNDSTGGGSGDISYYETRSELQDIQGMAAYTMYNQVSLNTNRTLSFATPPIKKVRILVKNTNNEDITIDFDPSLTLYNGSALVIAPGKTAEIIVTPYSDVIVCEYKKEVSFPEVLNIPDAILKTALYNLISTHEVAGEITKTEALTVSFIPAEFLSSTQVESLEGLSEFENITEIHEGAFRNCNQLATIELPPNLRIIGHGAFSYTNVVSVNLPDSVESIHGLAFNGCQNLTSINLDNVRDIGNSAFRYTNIQNVNLQQIESLGTLVFANCNNLVSAQISGSMNSLPQQTFLQCGMLMNVAMGSIRIIEEAAFFECSGLQTVDLNMIGEIRGEAFYGCNQLMTINLEHCMMIGMSAFENCSQLSIVENWRPDVNIETRSFANCGFNMLSIPRSNIMDSAFSNNNMLENIRLGVPDRFMDTMQVHQYAFLECSDNCTVEFHCDNPDDAYELYKRPSEPIPISWM